MKSELETLFGSKKYLIAALHFLPLPGSPGYDRQGGMRKIIDRAKQDARILVDNGVHSLLFTNEADMPYSLEYPTEAVAAFADAVCETVADLSIPFGINVLVDVIAALAIAHATGASYARGLFAGCYTSDMGIITSKGPKAFRLRSNLGSPLPYFFHNLCTVMGQPLVARTAEQEARDALKVAQVDCFTLPADHFEAFLRVTQVAPDTALLVGSGANFDNLRDLLRVSDGVIVATSLHEDGGLLNPVDPTRTQKFASLFYDAIK